MEKYVTSCLKYTLFPSYYYDDQIGEDVDWIYLAQDRDQWRAAANTVMDLRLPPKTVNFLTG